MAIVNHSWVLRAVRRIVTLSCELRRENEHSNDGIQLRQYLIDTFGLRAIRNVYSLESSRPCNGL